VKVIGNTGSNSTREAVHATQQGFAVGMDASLQINPYYGKTSRAGLLEHFEAVMDLGPAIVYNVPARTSQDIVPDVMFELAKHANFAGVKECEGNARIKQYTDNGVTCWTGNDDECHDARYDAGAVGVISVTSNLVPELMREMLFDGPNPELRDRLLPLMNWLFAETQPHGHQHRVRHARRRTARVPPSLRSVRRGVARAGRRAPPRRSAWTPSPATAPFAISATPTSPSFATGDHRSSSKHT
jgi:4-hydroxy-tetrahydrodipicolinate synthase